MSSITLLGLGPGNPQQITRQAWDWLNSISEVYLRTRHHPMSGELPAGLTVHSFDNIYAKSENAQQAVEETVTRVLKLGQRAQGVTYAVPGSPFIAEAAAPLIAHRARELGIPLTIIDGLSYIEPVCSALGIDPTPNLVLIDALELAASHHPAFPPSQAALIAQVSSRAVAAEVKLTLMAVYPDEYPVRLVHGAGTGLELVEDLPLYKIDRTPHSGSLTTLYIPAMPADAAFEDFQNVVARLRAPDGCPWDIKQTHESLRKYLLEETYEALDALDAGDIDGMREEFGDLLLQIVLHAQIAVEDGEFSMVDILQGINQKIVRRHPHVFGEVEVDGEKGVLRNWEKLKEEERKENGKQEKGQLDGVPVSLPSLSQAQEILSRAARVGFDWPAFEPVMAKVLEELEEVRSAPDAPHRAEELGDLLFAVVNLVRWYDVDAESALRQTNRKFRRRFGHIEKKAKENGTPLRDMALAEMEAFWEEAKGLD